MSTDLAVEIVTGSHRRVRALLDELARKPRISERIQAGQLRARQELVAAVEAGHLPEVALRERYLWPVVTGSWPDGRGVRRELVRQGRAIEHLLVKLRWFGDRDSEIDDVLDRLHVAIREQLRFEEEQLARHRRDPGRPDLARVARRMDRNRWRMPTRPHPDLPLAPWVARPLRLALFLVDGAVDATRFRATGS